MGSLHSLERFEQKWRLCEGSRLEHANRHRPSDCAVFMLLVADRCGLSGEEREGGVRAQLMGFNLVLLRYSWSARMESCMDVYIRIKGRSADSCLWRSRGRNASRLACATEHAPLPSSPHHQPETLACDLPFERACGSMRALLQLAHAASFPARFCRYEVRDAAKRG